MRRIGSFILIIGLLIIPLILNAGEKDSAEEAQDTINIAVLDLEANDVSQAEAEAVSEFLRTDLVNTKKFTVIERNRIQDIINEQQFSASGLTETENATKIGELLNCKYIIVGSLSKLEQKYFLDVRVVDVETGKTTEATREDSMKLDLFSDISWKIACKLAGIKYVPKSTLDAEPKKPPLGVDLGFNFFPFCRYSYIESETKLNENPQRKTYIIKPFNFKMKVGVYYSGLYIGLRVRHVKEDKGEDIELRIYDNGTKTNESVIKAPDNYIYSAKDIRIGYRLYAHGKIDSKITYFAVRFLKVGAETVVNNNKGNFIGFILGYDGRYANDLGRSPLDFIVDFGIYGGGMIYRKYEKYDKDFPDGKPWGLTMGSELALGVQMKKIGAYLLLGYDFEGLLYFDLKSNPSIRRYNFIHGLELKFGYTFDMPAFFE